MKILHVVHGFFPESTGGTEAYVRSLLCSQQALGEDPLLLHGSFEPRGVPEIVERRDLDVPAYRLHRADVYSDFWDRAHYEPAGRLFRDLLARTRPDLVHVHQWIRLTDDLVEITEAAGIPAVVSLHDVYASCPACFRLRPDDTHCEREVSFESCHDCVPLRGDESAAEVALGIASYRANFRHELLRARRVLAATHATAALVTAGLGLPADLVQRLPLGYEPRFAEPRPSPAAGERATITAAYWGNVTHRKGVQVLLAALRQLEEQGALRDRLALHVFGAVDTPALAAELETLARGLPVTLHGRYEYGDIAALAPDLAVFPSTCFETYGFVLDEAFELGVPALVTGVGAFAERLAGAGFLVPPGDAAALAALLRGLLDEPARLQAAAARIPPPAPDPLEHARLLGEVYRAARAEPPRAGDPPDGAERERLGLLRAAHDRSTRPDHRGVATS